MASVSVSIDIAAPVNSVWEILGDFNGMPKWLDFIRSSWLSETGRMRNLETINGSIIVEALLERSEHDMFYRYAILDGPDPVMDYIATLSARRISARKTTVTWASRFKPVDTEITALLVGHYEILHRAGLDRLKTLIETQVMAQ